MVYGGLAKSPEPAERSYRISDGRLIRKMGRFRTEKHVGERVHELDPNIDPNKFMMWNAASQVRKEVGKQIEKDVSKIYSEAQAWRQAVVAEYLFEDLPGRVGPYGKADRVANRVFEDRVREWSKGQKVSSGAKPFVDCQDSRAFVARMHKDKSNMKNKLKKAMVEDIKSQELQEKIDEFKDQAITKYTGRDDVTIEMIMKYIVEKIEAKEGYHADMKSDMNFYGGKIHPSKSLWRQTYQLLDVILEYHSEFQGFENTKSIRRVAAEIKATLDE